MTAPADEVSTADRSAAPPASPVRLTSITARASDGSEEVVIATAGGVPGWRIRYVDVVRVEEEPVLVAGEAVLEIVLAAADPSGEEGLAPEVAVDALVDQPIVRELRFVRYLAGEVTLAVGLAEQVPFTVSATPDSVVVTLQT